MAEEPRGKRAGAAARACLGGRRGQFGSARADLAQAVHNAIDNTEHVLLQLTYVFAAEPSACNDVM